MKTILLPKCTFTTRSPEVIRSIFSAVLYVPPGLAAPALGPARAGAVAPALSGAPGPALQEGGEVEQLLAGRNVRNSKRISFSNMYLLCTDNLSHTGAGAWPPTLLHTAFLNTKPGHSLGILQFRNCSQMPA